MTMGTIHLRPLELFVAVGAWGVAHPWPSQYICRPDPDGSGYHPGGVGALTIPPQILKFL